jgi:hypothetical protein
MDKFKDNLSEYIRKNHGTIGEFERTNNLKKNSVRYILDSSSQNTSIQAMVAVADAIGHSLDSMFGRPDFTIDKKLFRQTCKFVINYSKKSNDNKHDIDLYISAIEEIIKYCEDNNNGEFDLKFVSWYMKNNF